MMSSQQAPRRVPPIAVPLRPGRVSAALLFATVLILVNCAVLVANVKGGGSSCGGIGISAGSSNGSGGGAPRGSNGNNGGGVGSNVLLPRKLGPAKVADAHLLRQRLPKISAIYPVWYETDLMFPVIEAVAPFISELVVIDGPRRITMPLLASMGLMYGGADDSPVKRVLDTIIKPSFPHIDFKYHYQIWDDQKGQRNFGFNACSHPIMMQLEGDMLISFNARALEAFARDPEQLVSGTLVSNMVRSNVSMIPDVGVNPLHFFPMIAKRDLLTADEYFNHLWIVGKAQGPRNASQLSHAPVGYGYHLTLIRSLPAMASKYTYYRALAADEFAEDRSGLDNLLSMLPNVTAAYGQDVARELFVRSLNVSAFGLPHKLVHAVAPEMSGLFETAAAQKVDRLLDYAYLSVDGADGNGAARLPMYSGMSAWALLPPTAVGSAQLCLSLEESSGGVSLIDACAVFVGDYYLNARPIRRDIGNVRAIASLGAKACLPLPVPDVNLVHLFRGIGLACNFAQADAHGLRLAFLSVSVTPPGRDVVPS
jgi:hypothetical protein